MGEFLAVLGIVFCMQSILVVGLTFVLIRRGYLPKIFDSRKEDDISISESGTFMSSRRVQIVYAEGHVDVLRATMERMQMLSSSEIPLRIFSAGPQDDTFSSKVFQSGHFDANNCYPMTTKTQFLQKTEAA